MDENIEYYYSELQVNIGIVEEDEDNREALEAVTANFKAVFEYIKMFLIANKERYYGYFLMDMDLRIDYYFDTDAGVNMDTMPFTLIVNPLLFGRNTIKEMIYILCHEIEHIVLEHPAEGRKINKNFDPWQHVALNYAMDASVNDRLNMEINKYKMSLMSFPEGSITSAFLSDEYGVELDKLKDFLYYYDKIETFETRIVENSEFSDEEPKDSELSERQENEGKSDNSDFDESEDTECSEDESSEETEDEDIEDEDDLEDDDRDSADTEDKVDEETPEDEEDDDEHDDSKTAESGDGDGMSLEEWYDKLTSGGRTPKESMAPDDEHFWDEADDLIGASKKGKKRGKGKPKSSSNKTVIYVMGPGRPSRIITAKNRPNALPLHKWTLLDAPEEIKEQLRQFVQEVVDGIPDEYRGLFPSHQQEALKKVLEKPTIKWEQVLRKYIGTIPNGYRKTRTRLDRRQPERFDISGKISKHTIDLVVAIDTSGSMFRELLEKIFTEIFTILKTKDYHLTIIECDAEIQNVYEARSMADVKLEVNGRGGTAFTPVIEYVNKDRCFRKSLLIYFTDGMGEQRIPIPQVYRLLWVLPYNVKPTPGKTGFLDTGLSVLEPFGEVIYMNLDWYGGDTTVPPHIDPRAFL